MCLAVSPLCGLGLFFLFFFFSFLHCSLSVEGIVSLMLCSHTLVWLIGASRGCVGPVPLWPCVPEFPISWSLGSREVWLDLGSKILFLQEHAIGDVVASGCLCDAQLMSRFGQSVVRLLESPVSSSPIGFDATDDCAWISFGAPKQCLQVTIVYSAAALLKTAFPRPLWRSPEEPPCSRGGSQEAFWI